MIIFCTNIYKRICTIVLIVCEKFSDDYKLIDGIIDQEFFEFDF